MTSLASLLAQPPEAAVHTVGADVTPARVERAALGAGWRFAVIESADAEDKAAVLTSFRRGLGLPEWFGHNLDALVDALRDVGVDAGGGANDVDAEPSPGTVVLWDRPERFEAGHPDQYRAVLDILAQRAGDQTRPRVVVLVRPAPTTG